jgi:hypothetical protein
VANVNVSLIYQALPVASKLFERVRKERPIGTLFAYLMPFGSGAFDLLDIDPEEQDEILDWLIDDGDLFADREHLLDCFDDLMDELLKVETAYPGTASRRTELEKMATVIEARLKPQLQAMGPEIGPELGLEAVDLMHQLLYGHEPVFLGGPEPATGSPYEIAVGLVMPDRLALAAPLLQALNPRPHFDPADSWETYALQNLLDWQAFCLAAVDRQEAILVYQA